MKCPTCEQEYEPPEPLPDMPDVHEVFITIQTGLTECKMISPPNQYYPEMVITDLMAVARRVMKLFVDARNKGEAAVKVG